MGDVTTVQHVEPTHVKAVADTLRRANEQGLAVVVRGNGTKVRWGVPAARTDLILSMKGLHQPIEHCAGDLTVTVPAGATLSAVNAVLAGEGQWLALDPTAGGDSTIGGLLAANDSGPRRHRFGAPRDLVIGVEFALADGRCARGGGRVVKNVAGYDMGRLLCGSFGTLAVITSATFKLAPLAPASRTVVIDVPTGPALTALQRAIAASPLTPSAVELSTPPLRLLVRFETTAAAADEQAAVLMGLVAREGASGTILHGAAEADRWAAHQALVHPARTDRGPGALLRINVTAFQLARVLDQLAALARAGGLRVETVGRALLGALLVQVGGESGRIAPFVSELRRTISDGSGHVAVLDAPPDVRGAVSTWGDLGAAATLMRAVKAQFDPRGTLCPGGGPGGLA